MTKFIGKHSKYVGCDVIDFEDGHKELVIDLNIVTYGEFKGDLYVRLDEKDRINISTDDYTRIIYEAKAIREENDFIIKWLE